MERRKEYKENIPKDVRGRNDQVNQTLNQSVYGGTFIHNESIYNVPRVEG